MMFDGEHKVIPIKGIARAGADSLCEDGAMNEVIGLEYKDGSYVPYSGKITNPSTLPMHEDIQEIYVHKTSSGDNVILKIGGLLFWDEKADFDKGFNEDLGGFDEIVTDGEAKDVEFIGNVICISTDNSVGYRIFQEGAYKDWTVNKESLPHISFRVDIGIGGEKDKLGILHTNKVYAWDEGSSYKEAAISSMTAARGKAKEEGGLTGYFFVCAAYRTTTGEYIKASAPMLMCRPMHKYRNNIYNETDDSTEVTLYSNGNSLTITPTIPNENTVLLVGEDLTNYNYGSSFSYLGHSELGYGQYNLPSARLAMYYKSNNKLYQFDVESHYRHIFFTPLSCGIDVDMKADGEGSERIKVRFSSPVPTNKLQFKIDKDIAHDKTLIDSLCIFITKEVDPFLDFTNSNTLENNIVEASAYIGSSSRRQRAFYPIYKSNDAIISELKKENNFYKVHEIKFADIKASDEWIDVNLEGKLGDNLIVNETLPISSFDYSLVKSPSLDAYNNRLHMYNFLQEHVVAYGIQDYNLYGGYGQYNGVQKQIYAATIIIESNTTDGYRRVVKHYNTPTVTVKEDDIMVTLLPYVISCNDTNAYKITIGLNHDSVRYEWRSYDLVPFGGGSFSLFINNNLTPINASFDLIDESSVKMTNENNIIRRDLLRVSDTYNPNYFPPANTYTIGNGSIIGIASLSISLSQDTFGQYPLLVFCTDGIYSMGVDTTGTGVYNNIAPFSREVCINRNTICEIDGAVLFASSKGLMIATAQGVDEFIPTLNGEPKHLPQDSKDTKGLGLALYKEAINHELAVQLTGCISKEDFIDFLSDSKTVVTYASEKNNIVVYNPSKPYCYCIDIPTRNTTKLPVGIRMDNNNYPNEEYVTAENRIMMFKHLSAEGDVQCVLQSRPIKLGGKHTSHIRVVARGYFNSADAGKYAVMLVLGSYDGVNWQPLGSMQKPFAGGFHDLGCVVDRVSCEYLMVVVSGSLSSDSHIDGIELTKENKYINKLK